MLSREDDDPPEENEDAAQAPGAPAAIEDAARLGPAGLGRWLQRRHAPHGASDVRPDPMTDFYTYGVLKAFRNAEVGLATCALTLRDRACSKLREVCGEASWQIGCAEALPR